MSSESNLVWCHGCQTNVKPKVPMNECPQCGSRIAVCVGVPGERLDPDKNVVSSSALVLNPKTKTEGKRPLCPECEEPITRVESNTVGDNTFSIVEFRCGCGELQRYEF